MAEPDAAVYQDLVLHITSEKFFIEPLDDPAQLLVIDRVSQEISLQANHDQIPPFASRKPICGIMGIIRLLAGPYLVVITKKCKIGDVSGHSIWRVEETEVLSYSKTLLHLTEKQAQDNKTYLQMIQLVLHTEYYYFSTTYDLTHTMQRLHHTTPDFLQMPLHERADQRFVWNGHLLRELVQHPELNQFCLPVLHGFISVRVCSVGGKSFTWSLISRRSSFRAGTRLNMRGIDAEGNPANYVETEQIVEYNGDKCSFVQTRGSIPLFWSQKPNLKYKPKPQLSQNQNHADGFSRHFDNQIYNYGKQVLINLIDHKGPEMELEKTFATLVENAKNSNLRYESFDFHHECRKMRWDRLSILIDRVAQDQQDFGYFMMLRNGQVVSLQDGIFRTNCIDCLDRTNVVQSMLARRSLEDQLRKLGILSLDQSTTDYSSFDVVYKNVWADNADFCSIQYAGTSALKTDFTRGGKRTKFGLMKDGLNSMIRYYKNNFTDGVRQDAIDLFLGNYIVEENEGVTKSSPLQDTKDWKYLALPIIFLMALAMCFITLLIPAEYSAETLLYFLFWLAMSILNLMIIFYYGIEFVDQPRLCEINKKKD